MSNSAPSSRFPEIDKYDLVEEIGHGGMATVYRARDLRLDREVAVKVIHKHLRDMPEVRRRFVSEARAVAKLRHPGIVEVYDVSDEDHAERYLVVELVRGTTLRQVLQEHEVLPAEVAASAVAVLCEAVQHAHDCGVIHRDIKPENVLIELPGRGTAPSGRPRPVPHASSSEAGAGEEAEPEEPSDEVADTERAPRTSLVTASPARRASGDAGRVLVKLTDFGIAKVIDTQGVTSTGQILGSPAHMAPEQIEGGRIGPHTDVFALGVLMYECLVGHLPFEGRNPAQVLRRVLEGAFEAADSERPSVGGRWAGIVARALARDVEARLGTAAELGELILVELRDLGVGEPREQIQGFFADPQGHRRELDRRLVARLLERGELARQRGSVPGAAADFNRALALRPDDLTIFRRVSALAARTAWKRRASRLLGIALGSAALGVCTYGVTRWLRPVSGGPQASSATGRPAATAGASVGPAGPAGARSAMSASAPEGATGAPLGPPSALGSAARSAAAYHATPPTRRLRRVQFVIQPQGANLQVDGADMGNWVNRVFDLAPGSHAAAVTMPVGSKCCEPGSFTAVVEPPAPDDPDSVQHFAFTLKTRTTTVVLSGAPAGASFMCPLLGLVVSARSPSTVNLRTVTWTGTCEFRPSGRTTTVTLRAGESMSVPWLGD
ncbi:MAG: serine/threonine protein kinase [Deltaproteobacteria bacterium]|nr:serine/threonine protein kinase [Deltaproteobacteria bacterium]